ncbi:MAG: DUF427 domain-containing protein [Litoreibacter sp.]
MSDYIKLRPLPGTYSIRAAGAVLGESNAVIALSEGNLDPVLYVPRADVGMEFFDKTDATSSCSHKGEATYFTLQAKSGPMNNAAWSFEHPLAGLETIAGHLAFRDETVTVEEI